MRLLWHRSGARGPRVDVPAPGALDLDQLIVAGPGQLAVALGAADLIHRHVKPSNVLTFGLDSIPPRARWGALAGLQAISACSAAALDAVTSWAVAPLS